LDNFSAAAQRLKSNGLQALFLLGPAEADRYGKAEIQKISSAAPCLSGLSLTEVLGLLACADAFIGNDSGITHLAAGLGIRTFALFGPTDPCLYGPIGRQVTILTHSPSTFARKPSARSQSKLVDAVLSA